jgi:hypothetical protein
MIDSLSHKHQRSKNISYLSLGVQISNMSRNERHFLYQIYLSGMILWVVQKDAEHWCIWRHYCLKSFYVRQREIRWIYSKFDLSSASGFGYDVFSEIVWDFDISSLSNWYLPFHHLVELCLVASSLLLVHLPLSVIISDFWQCRLSHMITITYYCNPQYFHAVFFTGVCPK